MKKFTKALTLLLIVLATATLVACNTFGKVQKALENIGYEVIETNSTAESIDEESDIAVTIHVFSNKNTLALTEAYKLNAVIVVEFKATKDMIEYYKDSNTMQGIIKDINEDGTAEEFYNELCEKGLANGNCMVISTNPLARDEVCIAIKNA